MWGNHPGGWRKHPGKSRASWTGESRASRAKGMDKDKVRKESKQDFMTD